MSSRSRYPEAQPRPYRPIGVDRHERQRLPPLATDVAQVAVDQVRGGKLLATIPAKRRTVAWVGGPGDRGARRARAPRRPPKQVVGTGPLTCSYFLPWSLSSVGPARAQAAFGGNRRVSRASRRYETNEPLLPPTHGAGAIRANLRDDGLEVSSFPGMVGPRRASRTRAMASTHSLHVTSTEKDTVMTPLLVVGACYWRGCTSIDSLVSGDRSAGWVRVSLQT